jgi:hypothetical protein
LLLDQTIKRDREFAHATAGGVPNGIRNRARRARDADLTRTRSTHEIVGPFRSETAARMGLIACAIDSVSGQPYSFFGSGVCSLRGGYDFRCPTF